MNKKKIQRVISLVLCLVMVMSSAAVSVFADDVVLSDEIVTTAPSINTSSVTDATIDDVKEILDSMTYAEYFEKYSTRVEDANGNLTSEREWSVPTAKESIVINAVDDIYEEGTDADWKTVTYDGVKAVLAPASGTVAWTV